MSTTATPAANETKPDATATPAPAANATTSAPADKGQAAPAAADPKATGTAPAPGSTPAADAGKDVGGEDSVLDLDLDDDDDGEPASGEGDKPAEGEGEKPAEPAKDAKPAGDDWAKGREAAADAYLKKLGKKLSHDKDGKPLSDRQRQANIDDAREKFLSRLAKYPTREAALLALIDAQNKISSGKYKAALPDDATDDELAAWRKDNGIPDDAKGYKLVKVQGEEWTDADKPGLDKLLGRMHEKNASQAQVDAVLATYKEVIAEAKQIQADRIKAIDREDVTETRDILRHEYKPSLQILDRAFKDASFLPEDVGEMIKTSRMSDGRRLVNNAEMMRIIRDVAMWGISYPEGVPGALVDFKPYGDGGMLVGDQQAAANSEEQELINLMNTDIDAYNFKPWKTTGMTASQRLLEINRKKEARGSRRAA